MNQIENGVFRELVFLNDREISYLIKDFSSAVMELGTKTSSLQKRSVGIKKEGHNLRLLKKANT